MPDAAPRQVKGGTPNLLIKTITLAKLDNYLRHKIHYTQDIEREFADRHRSPAPVFQPGDKVWLLTRYIRTTRPSRKIDWKKVGRFEVKRRVSSHTYKLDLPSSIKIHPVFHISLLEPYYNNPFPGQIQASNPPPVVLASDPNNSE